MRDFINNNRRWLVWAVPAVVLLVGIGLESDWGRAWLRGPTLPPAATPRPVSVALAPEYQLPGGIDAYSETINRPLLTPNRRPSPPPPPPEPPKPTFQKGQFVLMGTTITRDKSYALLREVSSGKQIRVAQGGTVNGITVAKIDPNRVTLRQYDDTEDLPLKLALSPRTTVNPPAAARPNLPMLPMGGPGAGPAPAAQVSPTTPPPIPAPAPPTGSPPAANAAATPPVTDWSSWAKQKIEKLNPK